MSWAKSYIEKLEAGETVQFRPRGHSMSGIIESGQLVTVAPCRVRDAQKDDVVLVTVRGAVYLHLVKAVHDGQVQVGNAHGHINGWSRRVHGKLVSVED